jgi:hypothetical protein
MGIGYELLKTTSEALDECGLQLSGWAMDLPVGALIAVMVITLASYCCFGLLRHSLCH